MESLKTLATFQVEIFYDLVNQGDEETFYIRKVEPVNLEDIKLELEACLVNEKGNPELDRSHVKFNQNVII
jgi:hypothetical protein